MPRLSIYVQDDLWDRARGTEPKLNPSQLVQSALRRLVAEGTAKPAFAVPPAVEQTELQEIEQRLAEQARERYERGFRAGLGFSKALRWRHIDHLAGCNWDLRQWLDEERENDFRWSYGRDRPLFEILDLDEGVVEELTDELLPLYEREAAYRQGVIDALQQVRNAVMHTQSLGATGEEAGRTNG